MTEQAPTGKVLTREGVRGIAIRGPALVAERPAPAVRAEEEAVPERDGPAEEEAAPERDGSAEAGGEVGQARDGEPERS